MGPFLGTSLMITAMPREIPAHQEGYAVHSLSFKHLQTTRRHRYPIVTLLMLHIQYVDSQASTFCMVNSLLTCSCGRVVPGSCVFHEAAARGSKVSKYVLNRKKSYIHVAFFLCAREKVS